MNREYTLSEYVDIINKTLSDRLYGVKDGQLVVDAMRYAVENGGKRIRPVLTLEFCRVCGGEIENALNFACALEMIHTYSLIHDDLPCMDNDDYRRGKPSCHKKFGEEYALLAGDGLLTLAFETALADGNSVSAENKVKASRLLARLAGVAGMVGGQVLDLQSEGTEASLKKLSGIDELKTGALIKAACLLGCYAAGKTDADTLAKAETYAECVGHAFQIVDDILDVTSDSETLGKPVGSDVKNDKITYVSLMGVENAQTEVDRLTEKAVGALVGFDENTDFLKELAYNLAHRKK
ncbi:MAG: polyprenyl synthetase family protein [Clostridiaceae bacterium]|nr:polyprenyl synthetase family protein [Clostridiaceae bacterium]